MVEAPVAVLDRDGVEAPVAAPAPAPVLTAELVPVREAGRLEGVAALALGVDAGNSAQPMLELFAKAARRKALSTVDRFPAAESSLYRTGLPVAHKHPTRSRAEG